MMIQQQKNLVIPLQLAKVIYSKYNADLILFDQPDQIYGKALHGKGQVQFKNGNSYQGQFYNGMLHGKGKFVWKSGVTYQGTFNYNQIQGTGLYTFQDGSTYQGQIKNALKHGKGVFKQANNLYKYVGQWKQGKKSGHGKIQYNNGAYFEGEFQNDMKKGYGKMVYPSGNYYQGEWQNDTKQGLGTMNWINSQKYKGQWFNNKQHGQNYLIGFGTYIWMEPKNNLSYFRNKYQGEWVMGVQEGVGVFYFSNGCRYWGEWKNNVREGFGLFLDQNGDVQQRRYQRDQQIKKRRIKSEDQLKQQMKQIKVERNPYEVMIDISDLTNQIIFQANPMTKMKMQEYLNNYLLKINSFLKKVYNLYKDYCNISQHIYAMTLQGFWKMCRQVHILGHQVSLANINRMFYQGKKNFYKYRINPQQLSNKIEIIKKNKITYRDLNNIQYIGLAYNIYNNEDKFREDIWPQINIHDGKAILLYRNFVQLFVRVAFLKYGNIHQLHKSVDKLKTKIQPFIQPSEQKSSMNEINSSTSYFRKGKELNTFFTQQNQKLFDVLTMHIKNGKQMIDKTLRIKDVLKIFEIIGYIPDKHQRMLFYYKIQKHMDHQLTMFGMQYIGKSQISNNKQKIKKKNINIEIDGQKQKKLFKLLDYQIIFSQFNQMIFQYFIRKVIKGKSHQQQNCSYVQNIQKIIEKLTVTPVSYSKITYKQTIKEKMKKELIEKKRLKDLQMKRKEEESLIRQNQERQQALMSLQDINIEDQSQMQIEEQNSQFSDISY